MTTQTLIAAKASNSRLAETLSRGRVADIVFGSCRIAAAALASLMRLDVPISWLLVRKYKELLLGRIEL
jgi:hypothetical protein